MNFLLFLGVSLFCFGCALAIYRLNFMLKSLIAEGKVVDYEQHPTERNCYHPVIEYLTETNKKVVFKSSVSQNKKPYKIGEKISVRYLKSDPKKAEINKKWIIWFEVPICFLFAFILIWLGAFL
ncbi:MAG TPA: DUF3592 domain-containing protein [Pyrinomonadaceae bacterium]|nr:DUF3592 domain-containing protein [Pyrinomonadaceae bacterium]